MGAIHGPQLELGYFRGFSTKLPHNVQFLGELSTNCHTALEQPPERLLPGGGTNSEFDLEHSKLGGLRGAGDRGTVGCSGQGNWLLLAGAADRRRDQP